MAYVVAVSAHVITGHRERHLTELSTLRLGRTLGLKDIEREPARRLKEGGVFKVPNINPIFDAPAEDRTVSLARNYSSSSPSYVHTVAV